MSIHNILGVGVGNIKVKIDERRTRSPEQHARIASAKIIEFLERSDMAIPESWGFESSRDMIASIILSSIKDAIDSDHLMMFEKDINDESFIGRLLTEEE
jgi:hypothetical protein